MKLLAQPTMKYLLETGMEELHKQSKEWLNKVLFWCDEVDFFYSMIEEKKKKIVPLLVQNKIWHVEKELAKNFGSELFELQKAIEEHESKLRTLVLENGKEEGAFRIAHQQTAKNFLRFEKNFILLKRHMIEMIEQVEQNDAKVDEVIKNIYERRAVRKYIDKPVPKSIIKKVLEAGTMAPSATNKQPWRFYVLTKKETIHQFSREIVKAAMKVSSRSVIGLFNFPNGEEQMKISDMVFYHAPVVVFITSPRVDEWADLDIGMCAQNMMLAARSYGLESCPIGFAKFVEETELYPKLAIPETDHVDLAIIFGYGNEHPKMHERIKNTTTFID
jgi:nitroreductase